MGAIQQSSFKANWDGDIATVEYSGGEKYVGQVKNCEINGKGSLFFKDGNYYEGIFKDSRYNGKGRLTVAGGEDCEGQWKSGKIFDGTGKKDGKLYSCRHKNSQTDIIDFTRI